jgi:hypothetical protein
MGVPGEVEIKLVISEREIVRVEPIGSGVEVSAVTDSEHKEFKHSPYGLRPVETVYEVQITQSPTKCYMVIGGYKVQVPC